MKQFFHHPKDSSSSDLTRSALQVNALPIERLQLFNNENAYGPSPNVQALFNEIKGQDLARYADPASSQLVSLLSRQYNCSPKKLMIGAGSSELIELLCKVYGIGHHVSEAKVWPLVPLHQYTCGVHSC